MLNEDNFFHYNISRYYCSTRFGHYGVLATMPLFIAFTNAGLTLDAAFGCLKKQRAGMMKDTPTIHFEDSDYFTIHELQFFSTLSRVARPLTPHEIASDRLELSREIKEGRNICKSHAEYLLKAIIYWELRFQSKYQEWENQMIAASKARHLRLRLMRGERAPGEAASSVVVEDDGYESGFFEEEFEDGFESDFTEDGDENWLNERF